jgi:integrase/recombinase XerC
MQHLEKFSNFLQFEKRFSKHTILSYHNDLTQFSQFLVENSSNDDPASVDFRIIRRWIVKLVNNKISPRSVNRKLSALKSFYKFLLTEGLAKKNPLDKIVAPKVGKRLPVFIDEKHIDHLLDDVEFGEDYIGQRNKLIIELFYFTGIRLSELIEIKVNDVDFQNMTIKVLGKRNKERIVPISQTFLKHLQMYLNLRKIEFETTSEIDYFFISKAGKKLYSKAVYRVVNSYLRLVTLVEKKSPHVLRHTFATHMLNHGADLNAIKELLGHSNLSATQVYTHNTFEKLTKIYKQAHPRA